MAEFRTRYALELGQYREKLARLHAVAAERPVTLLFSTVDPIHNSASVLRDVLCHGPELQAAPMEMNHAELRAF